MSIEIDLRIAFQLLIIINMYQYHKPFNRFANFQFFLNLPSKSLDYLKLDFGSLKAQLDFAELQMSQA